MFGLRSGVLIFVSIESLFWALMAFAAIFSEIKYISNVDIGEFSDGLDNDWYYFVLFGYPLETIDERIRSKDGHQRVPFRLPFDIICSRPSLSHRRQSHFVLDFHHLPRVYAAAFGWHFEGEFGR
jgi:hypothetical protein